MILKLFIRSAEHAEHINDGDNNEPIMITLHQTKHTTELKEKIEHLLLSYHAIKYVDW